MRLTAFTHRTPCVPINSMKPLDLPRGEGLFAAMSVSLVGLHFSAFAGGFRWTASAVAVGEPADRGREGGDVVGGFPRQVPPRVATTE